LVRSIRSKPHALVGIPSASRRVPRPELQSGPHDWRTLAASSPAFGPRLRSSHWRRRDRNTPPHTADGQLKKWALPHLSRRREIRWPGPDRRPYKRLTLRGCRRRRPGSAPVPKPSQEDRTLPVGTVLSREASDDPVTRPKPLRRSRSRKMVSAIGRRFAALSDPRKPGAASVIRTLPRLTSMEASADPIPEPSAE
jgi:hypothetical protein